MEMYHKTEYATVRLKLCTGFSNMSCRLTELALHRFTWTVVTMAAWKWEVVGLFAEIGPFS